MTGRDQGNTFCIGNVMDELSVTMSQVISLVLYFASHS